jgi:hypothetical protein
MLMIYELSAKISLSATKVLARVVFSWFVFNSLYYWESTTGAAS